MQNAYFTPHPSWILISLSEVFIENTSDSSRCDQGTFEKDVQGKQMKSQ